MLQFSISSVVSSIANCACDYYYISSQNEEYCITYNIFFAAIIEMNEI